MIQGLDSHKSSLLKMKIFFSMKKKGKAISNQCEEPRRTSNNCVLDFTLILDRRALLVAIVHSSSRPRSQRRKAKMRMEPFHFLAGKAWGSTVPVAAGVDTTTVKGFSSKCP